MEVISMVALGSSSGNHECLPNCMRQFVFVIFYCISKAFHLQGVLEENIGNDQDSSSGYLSLQMSCQSKLLIFLVCRSIFQKDYTFLFS